MYNSLVCIKEFVTRSCTVEPLLGICTGVELHKDFYDAIKVSATLPFDKIPNFPAIKNATRSPRFVMGRIGKLPVMVMDGLLPLSKPEDVVNVITPIRIMCMLGVKSIIFANVCDSLSQDLSSGDIVLIRNFVSQFIPTTITSRSLEEIGVDFSDIGGMSSKILREELATVAENLSIDLKIGDYVQVTDQRLNGKEIKELKSLLCDVVGYGLVPESIAAAQMKVQLAGLTAVVGELGESDLLPESESISYGASIHRLGKILIGYCRFLNAKEYKI